LSQILKCFKSSQKSALIVRDLKLPGMSALIVRDLKLPGMFRNNISDQVELGSWQTPLSS